MNYLVENSGMLLNKTLEHLYISIMALILAMIVAIPLGILLSKKEKLSKVSLTIAGILQTIPTLAILALMIPLFGVMKDIELPLALPMVLSGIRLSSVYVISWAALASYVGAGGLGDLIFNGLALYEPEMIIVGTILVTLLALIVDLILAQIEKWIIPKGLKISR